MVVGEVNIARVPALKAEDDAPVCPDRHTPEAPEVAFEGMQVEPGQVLISSGFRATLMVAA